MSIFRLKKTDKNPIIHFRIKKSNNCVEKSKNDLSLMTTMITETRESIDSSEHSS